MTDRRRNLFVLLLVAALFAASAVMILSKPTRVGRDLKGGVSLTYQAKPTVQSGVTSDAINRTLDIMRERVDQLGVSEPEIQRSGSDQIDVALPDAKNADEAANQVGTTAQMYFYDWERNVLDANCGRAPQDRNVTGGPSAGSGVGATDQFTAVTRASKCPVRNLPNATTNGLFYQVDTKAKKVLAGPDETRRDLQQELQNKGVKPSTTQKTVKVPKGTIVVRAEAPSPKQKSNLFYLRRDTPALSGKEVKNPEQQFDNGAGGTGQPIVTFSFSDKGRKSFQRTTQAIAQRGSNAFIPGQDPTNARQHFAVVLDNELITTPYIDFQQNPDGIDATNGSQISGSFTIASPQRLANLLKAGALPIRLQLISSSQVSATLGKQALDQGLVAGIAGFVIVAIFLLIFYRILGVIAVGALLVYAVYFYALIKLIPITLTLPGIAGLILTIGVAADANIVIFERVKEEIRGGRSIVSGIATGYKKGLSAIIDANVVTIMTAFILFILATAGVKGFAFTLGIGTIVSLFTAVLATQAILGTVGRTRVMQSRVALGAGEQRHRWRFDFMGASRWFFSISGLILLVGALALGGKGLNFGIDFKSGTRIQAALVKPATEDQVRTVLATAGYGDAKIQKLDNKDLGNNAFQVSTGTLKPDKVDQVRDRLQQRFGIAPNKFSNNSIGPTFGQTVANSAVIAIIASLLVISAYIALRFEWKYAVPVLIALMHDLLITSGVYSLTGREVTTATVAALLTILGYSLYDTIIVFDRIRENVP